MFSTQINQKGPTRTEEDGSRFSNWQEQLDANPLKRQCRKPGGGRGGPRPNSGRKFEKVYQRSSLMMVASGVV